MVSVVSGITPATRVTPPALPIHTINGIDTMYLTDPTGLDRAIRVIRAERLTGVTGITGLGYDRAGCAGCEESAESTESTDCADRADGSGCRDR